LYTQKRRKRTVYIWFWTRWYFAKRQNIHIHNWGIGWFFSRNM